MKEGRSGTRLKKERMGGGGGYSLVETGLKFVQSIYTTLGYIGICDSALLFVCGNRAIGV